MSELDREFYKMVSDAGLPTTDDEAKAMWQVQAEAVGSPFNNNSDYSPFWRAVLHLVTKPLLWIVTDLLIKQVLPNLFLKTAAGSFLDLIGWGVDCERKAATKTLGSLTFSRTNTAGEVEIPLGTIVQSPTINGVTYKVKTTAPASIIDGQGSIVVSVEALEAGSAYNLAEGYYSVLATPIPGIDAVFNLANWLLTAGADEEKDDDYRLRIRNQFSAVNQYHTDAVYRKIITSFAGINTRNVFFEHGAPRGPGTANALILMDTGEPGGAMLTAIADHIMTEGNHGHGDDLQVFAMPHTTHNLTVTVNPADYLDETESDALVSNVEQAVRAAFRENQSYVMTTTQPYSLFAFSKLSQELHEQFRDLESVHFSLGDITSGLSVPRLGTLLVVLDD